MIYNTLAPVGVKKFTSREHGLKRIWKLIQELPPSDAPRTSKKDTVIGMLQREQGATLEELMMATGWQAHSVRGFISTQRKEYSIQRHQRTEDSIAYYATKK
ncbi:MAG: DUF3489 domain-containing protein [Bryobacteraceae bacterium]|nr:DUF3489 domain-containing protein [Bryobacteraceae bacterium]